MKKFFRNATVWELTNIFWWITYIILVVFVFLWWGIKKPSVFISNWYFYRFILPKKDKKFFYETVYNFERYIENQKDAFQIVEGEKVYNSKFKKRFWMHIKYYDYCNARLKENGLVKNESVISEQSEELFKATEGERIVVDNGRGYEIGYYKKVWRDETNTHIVFLSTGISVGVNIVANNELYLYSLELVKELSDKYGYVKEFSETF